MTTTTPPVSVGDEMPTVHVEITRADLRRYAEASGDHNPIHLRDEAARELGLPGVVAHGMLTSALAIGEVARWAGEPIACWPRRSGLAGLWWCRRTAAVLVVSGTVRKVAEDGASADVAMTVTCDGASPARRSSRSPSGRDFWPRQALSYTGCLDRTRSQAHAAPGSSRHCRVEAFVRPQPAEGTGGRETGRRGVAHSAEQRSPNRRLQVRVLSPLHFPASQMTRRWRVSKDRDDDVDASGARDSRSPSPPARPAAAIRLWRAGPDRCGHTGGHADRPRESVPVHQAGGRGTAQGHLADAQPDGHLHHRGVPLLIFMTALVSGVDFGAGKLVEIVFDR